jgi:hypothetical protein
LERKWFDNKSGVCPVPEGTLIDVRYRDEDSFDTQYGVTALNAHGTEEAYWELEGCRNDIFEWRYAEGEDGWISNVGNKYDNRPVDSDKHVEVVFRNNDTDACPANSYYWNDDGTDDWAIVKWRLAVKPVNEEPVVEAVHDFGYDVVADDNTSNTLTMTLKVDVSPLNTKLLEIIKAQAALIEALTEQVNSK